MHRQVQGEISRLRASNVAQPGAQCSRDIDWFQVAAGLLPESQTRELMLHAAQCGLCGPLLRNAAETLSDETTPNEEGLLAGLSSGHAEWQLKLAGKLRDSLKPERLDSSQSRWKAFVFWPRPLFVAGALAVAILMGWLGLTRLRAPSAEQLLAQAYTKQRTLELRIPGARYAAMQVVRGNERSRLNRPPELLEAEALIAQKLADHPHDPRWLQAKGRSDLLDGNYSGAIEALESARGGEPDSPSLLADLGNAYFQRGDTEGRTEDYATAIDCYGRALSKVPDDPVVLFNRAIALERMSLFEPAVKDWQKYLNTDPKGDWSQEAQFRLDKLLEKLKSHERSMSEPLLAPSEIGQMAAAHDPLLVAALDGRIEDYLQIATNDWLPSAFRDARVTPARDLRYALALLAGIAKTRHKDVWLSEMLEASSSPAFPGALHDLSNATKASAVGDFATAAILARSAALSFHDSANLAGELRSKLEEIYALQLSTQGKVCAEAAVKLAGSPTIRRYTWLAVQLELEEGVCLSLTGNLGRAQMLLYKAGKMADEARYGVLYLRATAFMADLDADGGSLRTGWRRAAAGLTTFWAGTYPAMRGYNLYASMDELADAAEQWHLQVAVWQQAIAIIGADEDTLLRAMAYSRLGTAAFMSDMMPEAKAAFDQASSLLNQSPQSEASRSKSVDIAIWLARVEAKRAQPDEAIARLQAIRPELNQLSSRYVTMDFYQAMAELQSRREDFPESERALRSAIALSEEVLRSLHSETDRTLWTRQNASAYRMLVELKLRQQDMAGALELWEWYRGAPLRVKNDFPADVAAPSQMSARALDAGPELPILSEVARREVGLTTQTVISYASLPSGLATWVYDNRGLHGTWNPSKPDQLKRDLRRFVELCSDPKSNLTMLRQQGNKLYAMLIAGVADWLTVDRQIVIEADSDMEGVPLEALVDAKGEYFAEHYTVAWSPGLYYAGSLRPESSFSRRNRVLVVGSPAGTGNGNDRLAPLPDAIREAQSVARQFPSSRLLVGREATLANIRNALPGAEIFHFAGHAVTRSTHLGLLVASDRDGEFSDTLLDAPSLSTMGLQRIQLAVLSACSTENGADGNPVDPDSLVRVFLRFGVPHVVASRWNVDSAVTAAMMDGFYAGLLSGRPVAESLRLAGGVIREKPATAHPYYWAAFSSFGVT
jgi:CHAT domain-containing protein/Flp pilus assembly protein TadD